MRHIHKEAVMPLFMDIHENLEGVKAEDAVGAHRKDLEVGPKYGVNYLHYWLDESAGKIFCLVDAPDKEAATRVHSEAHGLVADKIFEVTEG
jgi:Nickel responsive protein SCO4226-like